jgi:predicted phosphodiesterase
MSTTNTGHKFISLTSRGYVVSLPPEVSAANNGVQRYQRKRLVDAIYLRNMAFGYDPDAGVVLDFKPVHLAPTNGDRIRFGVLSDTHLCSLYEALDPLHNFYDEMKAMDVKHVFHAGNWVDGDKFKSEIHTWGVRNQLVYFLNNYPQREGVTSHILDGDDHEGWWFQNSGILPGETLVNLAPQYERTDLNYLGYIEQEVHFPVGGEDVRMRIMHGGGGSAKSVSLASQNIIDGTLTPSEVPDILVLGHYHKAHFLPNYRGCFCIQAGCFEWQTTFMRKKVLHSAIGGWIIEVTRNAHGRLRVSAEYLSYKPKPWTHKPGRVDMQL